MNWANSDSRWLSILFNLFEELNCCCSADGGVAREILVLASNERSLCLLRDCNGLTGPQEAPSELNKPDIDGLEV